MRTYLTHLRSLSAPAPHRRPRLLLLVLLLGLTGLTAQTGDRTAVFPAERHGELREEIRYEAPEEEEEEEEEETSEPWSIENLNIPPAVAYLIIGGMLLLLGLLVYRVLGDVELRQRTKKTGAEDEISIEEIEEEALVASGVSLSLQERAENAGQYDIAVRLLYIQLLKDLQDNGLIRYRRDYSNRDYQGQLATTDFIGDFREVTVDYERYWFGKYAIDPLSYRLVKRKFAALMARLSATRKTSA